MPKCGCSGDVCSCKIQAGTGIVVNGSGSANDPYVISMPSGGTIQVSDTSSVNLTLLGSGSPGDPYILSATVDSFEFGGPGNDIANAATGSITNGYVPIWNNTTQKWTPGPAATATPGALNVASSSFSGDGSSGSQLSVKLNPSGLLTPVGTTGLDLKNDAKARMGQAFANDAARSAWYSANSVTVLEGHQAYMLDTDSMWVFDGSAWVIAYTPGLNASWQFNRVSANVYTDYDASIQTALGTITNAKSGRYRLVHQVCSQSGGEFLASVTATLTVGATTVDETSMDNTFQRTTQQSETHYVHPGGTMNIAGYLFASHPTAPGPVMGLARPGTRILVQYLGK